MPVNLLIGADIVPTETNFEAFRTPDVGKLVDHKLLSVLQSADYRIFNLETPLTDTKAPLPKHGPQLSAPAATATGIKALGADFLTLANNHILDQGAKGLADTRAQLDKLGIAYAGAGETPEEAEKPYVVEKDGCKIGIYCCAEHEFSIVTETTPGANPFDPLKSLDHIVKLKKSCDYVIVLYHGGKEHYPYPSPRLRQICRKLVEKGADLVVCQHSHCIGCEENLVGGTVIYGQGNFLFDASERDCWQTGLLLSVEIGSTSKLTYLPIRKNAGAVGLAEPEDAAEILKAFRCRSEQLNRDGFVKAEYSSFADEMLWHYLAAFSGKTLRRPVFRMVNRLSGYRFAKWYLQRKYPPAVRLSLINIVECEAHRELLLEGLKGKEQTHAATEQ